jgi:hypothetical protein
MWSAEGKGSFSLIFVFNLLKSRGARSDNTSSWNGSPETHDCAGAADETISLTESVDQNGSTMRNGLS